MGVRQEEKRKERLLAEKKLSSGNLQLNKSEFIVSIEKVNKHRKPVEHRVHRKTTHSCFILFQDKSSSYLNAYLSGKARGFKKARSSNMSWSLILLTFSGLREEMEREGVVHFYVGRKWENNMSVSVCLCSYASFARSELRITWSKWVAALRKLATARFSGSERRHRSTVHTAWQGFYPL